MPTTLRSTRKQSDSINNHQASMLSIKGGHTKAPQGLARSAGSAGNEHGAVVAPSLASKRQRTQQAQQQVHQGHHRQQANCAYRASRGCAGWQRDQRQWRLLFGKRADGGPPSVVRRLSIVSLILIVSALLAARECNARAFLGLGANGANTNQQEVGGGGADIGGLEGYSDKQLPSPSSSSSGGFVGPVELDTALELGCRNLVGE
jgi:hypothetical protein